MEEPWSMETDRVVESLETDAERGLSNPEVERRRERYGPNRLRETSTRSLFEILVDQLKSLIVLLLVLAAAVALLFGEWIESIAIGIVILINTAIGFFTELRAVRSMESLKKLGGVRAYVLRNGEFLEIDAEDLVPGDVVKLTQGDLITADLRLVETKNLQIDESALTGESVPVEKSPSAVEADTPLAERSSMVYKGTVVTRGAGVGVVTATGTETELGEISELVEQAEAEQTPLEKRLQALGNKLIWLTLLIAGLVTVSGVLAGRELYIMIETGIALAVAAVPEGLPIVATMALARGMWRMADRNALINRLSAVETLGSTTVILTDKTGTLTENEMTLRSVFTPDGDYTREDFPGAGDSLPADLRRVLEIGSLCSSVSFAETGEGERETVGDPMEAALVEAGREAGLRRRDLLEQWPEVGQEAFSTDTKMMATVHEREGSYYYAVKGAPEEVLSACTRLDRESGVESLTGTERDHWLEANRTLADRGLRLLAMAHKTSDSPDEQPYEDLVFAGFVALLDPPRRDVRGAIKRCFQAGIRVVMVTGDMKETARNIGQEVGLIDDSESSVVEGRELEEDDSREPADDPERRLLDVPIFARVTPRQKLRLIELHQDHGGVAGMTGDGVNDAPALKKADIGIAMGQRGTQVAQEAADMVLLDDAFESIVAAIEQGRVIFENIRKFVFYLLSCNVSEIFVVGLASLLTIPLPILPLQILFLNLVTDVFPALALGMGEGEEFVMQKPPRDPGEPILGRSHWLGIGGYGVVFTVAVLGALLMADRVLGLPQESTVTVSFLTLAFAQLWHVFNLRDFGSGLVRNDVTRNPYVWYALALCVGLLLIACYVPILARVMKVYPPGLPGWGLILGMSLIPLVYGQILKTLEFRLVE